MKVIKSLHEVGDYSFSLVMPNDWLSRNENPREVEIRIGRERIVMSQARPTEKPVNAEER